MVCLTMACPAIHGVSSHGLISYGMSSHGGNLSPGCGSSSPSYGSWVHHELDGDFRLSQRYGSIRGDYLDISNDSSDEDLDFIPMVFLSTNWVLIKNTSPLLCEQGLF